MLCRIICSIGFIILSSFPLLSQGVKLAGKLTDQESDIPVPYVTVYVNGTTRGTISNSEGSFAIHGIVLPCELILSHVSYDLQRLVIEDTSGINNLHVLMKKKLVQIQELTVIGDSSRHIYLERFKQWFLGAHYKKSGARILNDSALFFIPMEGEQFEAYANEALIIDLPQTGYQLLTDLVHFKLNIKEELGGFHCSILGYFYFEEIPANNRRKQRALARNRINAYYNSRLHFCRSLYSNNLAENGYKMKKICFDQDSLTNETDHILDFKKIYSEPETGKAILYLTDFPCPYFKVSYYHTGGNKPVDLTYLYAHPSNLSTSFLFFANDTIRILSSGRVAENTILFNGVIGDKGVAWMLPEDYIPSMQ
ncbi:MAG: carboxypeptidase-like regulatory domain-containing protein [Desulfobacterales bacterium]|nr:carboxypeptidase-like regulatory domain-containing protein [Bacteroides sp.]MDX2439496.1 carboxypeptidase-like regulatory domain-containing protein [Desulfobacterales bacterium]